MQLADKYLPETIEQKWYDFWIDNNLFHSEPDEREPYTIVIPPPNVTGMLHMGHMLNNTLQDVLVRRARMQGKNACWVPGTDHASIATEAKVVAKLKAEGIDKSSLTREEFLKHAWEWKEKHGGCSICCDFLMWYIGTKTSANSVWSNLTDLTLIRTIFTTLSRK